jgi:hypothetical protein
MACSLASRIALYEAGAKDVQFIEVDPAIPVDGGYSIQG